MDQINSDDRKSYLPVNSEDFCGLYNTLNVHAFELLISLIITLKIENIIISKN